MISEFIQGQALMGELKGATEVEKKHRKGGWTGQHTFVIRTNKLREEKQRVLAGLPCQSKKEIESVYLSP